MNPLTGLGIAAGIIYWMWVDAAFFKIYFVLLMGYIVLTQLGTYSKYNSGQKKLNIATWSGIRRT